MKRFTLLLLMLCLLLTACSPAVRDPQATTELVIDPPSESSTGVKVDYSAYTPKETIAPNYTRLTEDPIAHLQPNKNGRQIYPFIGQMSESSYALSYHYGIVDETGCILADPVYTDVFPLLDEDTGTVLPYWVLEKTEGEINSDLFYSYGTELYALASMDGSFVTECIYSEIYCNDGRIMVFHQKDSYDDPTSFEVWDLECNFLFSSDSLSFSHKLYGDPYYYKHGQGLYTAIFENLSDYPEITYTNLYDEREYYLMNEKGEILAGPFYDVVSLTGGPIAVMIQSGEYVYVNLQGEVLCDSRYYLEAFRKDSASIERSYDPYYYSTEGPFDLVNGDLETLETSTHNFNRMYDGNYYVSGDFYVLDEEGCVLDWYNLTTCYSPKGEVLWTRDGLYEAFTSTIAVKKEWEPDGYYQIDLYLEHIPSGKTYTLPEYSDITIMGTPEDPILEVEYYQEDTTYKVLLSDDFEVLQTTLTYPTEENTAEIGAISTKSLIVSENGTTTVYTGGHEIFAQYPISRFNVCNLYPNRIGAFTDESCTRFYNAEGEVIFAYPISNMDD